MRRLMRNVLFLLVILPPLEFVLAIQVGKWVGSLPTLVIMGATATAGFLLAKREGLCTLAAARRELAAGRPLAAPVLDGVLVLAGAFLLVTPGFLTDVVGFALITPWLRPLWRRISWYYLLRLLRPARLPGRVFRP